MSHTHEWRFDIYEKDEKTVCRFVCSCGITMEGQEVLKRLNATDRLSARQANAHAAAIEAEGFPANQLRDYAASLEGKA